MYAYTAVTVSTCVSVTPEVGPEAGGITITVFGRFVITANHTCSFEMASGTVTMHATATINDIGTEASCVAPPHADTIGGEFGVSEAVLTLQGGDAESPRQATPTPT